MRRGRLTGEPCDHVVEDANIVEQRLDGQALVLPMHPLILRHDDPLSVDAIGILQLQLENFSQ
jgi:hypothetical protein